MPLGAVEFSHPGGQNPRSIECQPADFRIRLFAGFQGLFVASQSQFVLLDLLKALAQLHHNQDSPLRFIAGGLEQRNRFANLARLFQPQCQLDFQTDVLRITFRFSCVGFELDLVGPGTHLRGELLTFFRGILLVILFGNGLLLSRASHEHFFQTLAHR